MKYLLGIILSLTSWVAAADPIPFPTCVINNQPVSYRAVQPTFSNSYAPVYVAGSDIVRGRAVITYNSVLLSSKPKEWTLQVMLHECAHLKLHAIPDRNPPDKEYEADCYSANILTSEYGYKEKDFDIVINTMKAILPPDRIAAINTCLKR